jgi:hypothetical protein
MTARCTQCGMVTKTLFEYHPYAACLMYMTARDATVVRANLNAVVEYGKSFKKRKQSDRGAKR